MKNMAQNKFEVLELDFELFENLANPFCYQLIILKETGFCLQIAHIRLKVLWTINI